MNGKPTLHRPRAATTVVVAALAAAVAVGIITAVIALFESRGTPLAQLATAERACASLQYISDRENCMREWLAARRVDTLASK